MAEQPRIHTDLSERFETKAEVYDALKSDQAHDLEVHKWWSIAAMVGLALAASLGPHVGWYALLFAILCFWHSLSKWADLSNRNSLMHLLTFRKLKD